MQLTRDDRGPRDLLPWSRNLAPLPRPVEENHGHPPRRLATDLAGTAFGLPAVSDEWVEWHRQYAADGMLSRRLKVVQDRLREALDRAPPGPIRLLSMCAGDGRDVLGALDCHPRRHEVRARLVDLSPELSSAGRAEVSRRELAGVEFVTGDASTTRAYAGIVPANVLLVCGVFGNISDSDIRNTIAHLPELCAPDATVVWTRGRFEPDLTPTIRGWFSESGFAELSFVSIPETTASVGAHRLTARPRPFRPGVRLFTFLPKDERPSQRAKGPGSRSAAETRTAPGNC